MKLKKLLALVLSLLVLCSVAVSCASDQSAKTDSANLKLKIGLMPAVDSAPFYLAEKRAYFKEQGLELELQLFTNAQERQSALQTQTIDGAVTDLVAVATNITGGFDIKACSMTNGIFPVLMKEGADAKQDIKAGMMEVSVTNFLMEEYLGDKYKLEKIYINDIPARLAAIGSGELDMGIFPEPVASMGELSGLKKVIYPTKDAFCPDVLVFTGKALKEKEQAIEKFYLAYNKAVADLEKDAGLARDILLEKIPNLKAEIKEKIVLPQYTQALLPDDAYLTKIIQWTAKIVNKELKISAADLVERKFVNK